VNYEYDLSTVGIKKFMHYGISNQNFKRLGILSKNAWNDKPIDHLQQNKTKKRQQNSQHTYPKFKLQMKICYLTTIKNQITDYSLCITDYATKKNYINHIILEVILLCIFLTLNVFLMQENGSSKYTFSCFF